MKVVVRREACVGAGQCVIAADEVFDQDDEGLVIVLDANPEDGRLEKAKQAASLCPARAISIVEND